MRQFREAGVEVVIGSGGLRLSLAFVAMLAATGAVFPSTGQDQPPRSSFAPG